MNSDLNQQSTESIKTTVSRFSIGTLVRRPETGSFIGLVAVFTFFVIFGGTSFVSAAGAASWLNVAASLGIIALPIGLLMIAGHLDISIGSMIPASSMTIAIVSGHYHAPIFVGIMAALGLGIVVGLINGTIVIRTAVPSFIVTLATLFAVAGITLGLSVILTGSTSVGLKTGPVTKFLLGQFIGGMFQVTILWWVAIAAIVGFILHFLPYGNWILALGGDQESARNAGIPTDRVTVLLFVSSSFCAAFVGMSQAILYNSAQVSAGMSFIFNSIISVVVGGVLLTGGYGSVVGTVMGTVTFAIVNQGIYYTNFDANWASLIIGVLLLAAVLMNNTFRNMALTYTPAKRTQPDTRTGDEHDDVRPSQSGDIHQERDSGASAARAHEQHVSEKRVARQTANTPDQERMGSILTLTGIDKSFGPIDVLHDISLNVNPGEVLCLLGDNGAGKSTLIKILCGVHKPTSGKLEMEGKPVEFDSPRDASELGIATVHQFGGTFPLMSIGRSFFVGAEPTKRWGPLRIYDRKRANAIAIKEIRELGITRIDDGDRLVGGLSGGERQALAIARAVHFGARVLILDEPTAALGVKEAAHVLRIVLQARQKGIVVIFITHNVVHALTVGDHFAVLIKGAKAADFRKGERSREEITDLMAGGEHMAELEAEIESYMATHEGHAPANGLL